METFLLKLAIAVIPLATLILLIPVITSTHLWHSRKSLSWHRKRRSIQQALANGIMLR